MDFAATEEQSLIAESVRDFAADVIGPHVREWDEAQAFPDELWQRLGELGCLGVMVPEEYGGAGLGQVELVTVIEELARVDASVALAVAAHNGLCVGHIMLAGSEDQKSRTLPKLATGEWIGCWGLTEPQAGSDAGGTQARAVWSDERDAWILDGTKTFNTNGARARIAVIHAVTAPDLGKKGISAFIVDCHSDGFRVGRKEDKLGMRASDTVELILEGVAVPADGLLGDRDRGFIDALRVLDGGRISIAALAVGIAQASLDAALAYARERHQFGNPIGSFYAVRAKLARMATNIRAARALVWRAAALRQAGERVTREAAMAKLYASEIAVRAAEDAVQIYGGYGYVKDYPVEKYYRDVKLCTIGEGTSEIQRLVIARQLLP